MSAICATSTALNIVHVLPDSVGQSTLLARCCLSLVTGRMLKGAKLAVSNNADYCPKQTQMGLQNKPLKKNIQQSIL